MEHANTQRMLYSRKDLARRAYYGRASILSTSSRKRLYVDPDSQGNVNGIRERSWRWSRVWNTLTVNEWYAVLFTLFTRSFAEYNYFTLTFRVDVLPCFRWWISSVNKTPVRRQWITTCHTQYISQVYTSTLCITPDNLYHLPPPLPNMIVTHYPGVDNVNPDDILN